MHRLEGIVRESLEGRRLAVADAEAEVERRCAAFLGPRETLYGGGLEPCWQA